MRPLTHHVNSVVAGDRAAPKSASRVSRAIRNPLVVIGLLWLAHAGMNLAWRLANVTVVGWDRSAHLLRALDYLRMLQPFGVEGLMNVVTRPAFYPPFYHLSLAGAFALFGASSDSGAMVNAAYLAVLLLSVFGIGEHLFDRATGIVAAVFISFFPIIFNLSRFTYIEFSLTALVALNVCCLLRSQGFKSRRWSWCFGLSLGLGLLSKWVFVVFAAPPLLYVLLTPQTLANVKVLLRETRLDARRLVMCALPACCLSAAWFWTSGNWEMKHQVGPVLAVVYALALTGLFYMASRRSRPITNLLAAMLIAVVVAAAWYVPNLQFIETALFKAYHVGSEAGDAFDIRGALPLWVLFRGIVKEDLSAPIALSGLALFATWLVRRRRILPLPGSAWLLALWFLIPLAFFASFSNETSWNMRLTVPILLPVGLALARLWVGFTSAARHGPAIPIALLAVMVAQWVVLSLDAFSGVPAATTVTVPVVGRVGWFAGGEFAQWPSTGPTDEEYNMAAPVLRAVLADGEAGTQGRVSLGLLVNQPYLNGYRATFVAEQAYPAVEVVDLYRDRNGIPVYPDLFRLDYLLLSNSGVRLDDGDEASRVVTSILTRPTADFLESFNKIRIYEMPNGDRLHLYVNRLHRPPSTVPPELMPHSAGQVVNLKFGDRLLLASYDVDTSAVETGHLKIDLLWVGLQSMSDDYRMTLKLVDAVYHEWARQEGHPGFGSDLTATWAPGDVVLDRREIVVPMGTPPGSYRIELSVYGEHEEQELRLSGGKSPVLGAVDLPRRPHQSLDDAGIQHRAEAEFGGNVRLVGFDVPDRITDRNAIPVTLYWQATRQIQGDYTVFAHLVDRGGRLWGQKDNEPANGFYRTSSWAPGELVRDPYLVPVDPTAPPGEYYLQLGLYRPDTGERLPITGAAAPDNDRFVIGPLTIRLGS